MIEKSGELVFQMVDRVLCKGGHAVGFRSLRPWGLEYKISAYSGPTGATQAHLLIPNSKLSLTPNQFLLPFLNILCSFWKLIRVRITRNVFYVLQISYVQGHKRLPIIPDGYMCVNYKFMEYCSALWLQYDILSSGSLYVWATVWQTFTLKGYVVNILDPASNIMPLSYIFLCSFVCLFFYNPLKM